MSVLTIVLVLLVCFLAGCESVLDQFQFHQPIIACTLIGIVTGEPIKGIVLGGTLQLIVLGWMNIGAAVAPDAALASIASAFLVCGPAQMNNDQAIAIAIPFAMAGLVLTTIVRTITITFSHVSDRYAQKGNVKGVEIMHMSALLIQGIRVVIPVGLIMLVDTLRIQAVLNAIPSVITQGLAIAGGFIVIVGYAMVINIMATKEVWPFFFVGFALASLTELNLIAMGIIGLVIAIIYISLSPKYNKFGDGRGSCGNSLKGKDASIDSILNDY